MGGTVDILMATYNGEERLPRQLATLAAQTWTDWRLIVRDDGSTDGTLAVIEAFGAAHPGKVRIVRDERGNLRTQQNFSALMMESDAPYCNFCDQDDEWDEDKLAVAMQAMQEIEAEHGPGRPAMVSTDRRMVDEAGRLIAESFWRHQGVHPDETGPGLFGHLLYFSTAGSSTLINAALRDKARPVPREAMQYDNWVELVAAQFAVRRYLDVRKLTYIRHSANVSGGGRAYPVGSYFRRAVSLLGNLGKQRRVYGRVIGQARAFLDRYGAEMPAEDRERLEAFVGIGGAFLPLKVLRGARSGALPRRLERRIAFLLLS